LKTEIVEIALIEAGENRDCEDFYVSLGLYRRL